MALNPNLVKEFMEQCKKLGEDALLGTRDGGLASISCPMPFEIGGSIELFDFEVRSPSGNYEKSPRFRYEKQLDGMADVQETSSVIAFFERVLSRRR